MTDDPAASDLNLSSSTTSASNPSASAMCPAQTTRVRWRTEESTRFTWKGGGGQKVSTESETGSSGGDRNCIAVPRDNFSIEGHFPRGHFHVAPHHVLSGPERPTSPPFYLFGGQADGAGMASCPPPLRPPARPSVVNHSFGRPLGASLERHHHLRRAMSSIRPLERWICIRYSIPDPFRI